MSKCIYQHAVEPITLDARVRRLEHQVLELTQLVAALSASRMFAAEQPVPAGVGAEAGRDRG
jgi:hypothetical protein